MCQPRGTPGHRSFNRAISNLGREKRIGGRKKGKNAKARRAGQITRGAASTRGNSPKHKEENEKSRGKSVERREGLQKKPRTTQGGRIPPNIRKGPSKKKSNGLLQKKKTTH